VQKAIPPRLRFLSFVEPAISLVRAAQSGRHIGPTGKTASIGSTIAQQGCWSGAR
jgi:hypothetical protein